MKFKKINFKSPIKVLFLKDVDTENVLVYNKISFGEKNYKYFISFMYDGHKVNPNKFGFFEGSFFWEGAGVILTRPSYFKKLI